LITYDSRKKKDERKKKAQTEKVTNSNGSGRSKGEYNAGKDRIKSCVHAVCDTAFDCNAKEMLRMAGEPRTAG
jgi:hypothetical protein